MGAKKIPIVVGKLDWRRAAQTVHDVWRRQDRVCLYRGHCACCGKRVFGFEDGDNDPRGMLGDRAYDELLGAENDMHPAANVTACFNCTNTEWSYRVLMDVLRARSERAYRREARTCEGLG